MLRILSILFIFIVIIQSEQSFAQIAPNTYWVEFTDKDNSPYSINAPEEFLSERSIIRRIIQNIAITESDLPINQHYLDSLEALGITIHSSSKWFNGAAIISNDSLLIDTLHNIFFIKNRLVNFKAGTGNNYLQRVEKFCISQVESPEDKDNQLSMLNLSFLHDSGYKGQDILIGVLDSGFEYAAEIESLDHLWTSNRIIALRDFVNDGEDMLANHYHGTIVTSIIGANWPNMLQGAAPEASYALIRTENANSEYLVEEYNWIAGAEYADSLGVDIINSSLGYATFFDESTNHTYEDLDGRTTPISIGATMAARKGIIVVTSAGNAGNDPWRYITAPADADSILSIAAVDADKNITDFSSRGPTADGRIKPNISARGALTDGQRVPGRVSTCSGTSCSAPLITGLAASLLCANPNSSAQEIIAAIQGSSDRFHEPNTAYGYGIPNAHIADKLLKYNDTINQTTSIKLFPNPTYSSLYLLIDLPWLTKELKGEAELIDLKGSVLHREVQNYSSGLNTFILEQTVQLDAGYYFVKVNIDGRNYSFPFIKVN